MKSVLIIISIVMAGALLSSCSTTQLMKECKRTFDRDGKQSDHFVCKTLKPWE